MLDLFVAGTPKPQGSKALGYRRDGSAFMREANSGHKHWRDTLIKALQAEDIDQITAPIEVSLTFLFDPPKRPQEHPATRATYDIDKISRTVLDALTLSGRIQDDSRVVQLKARKRWAYGFEEPGVYITVNLAL